MLLSLLLFYSHNLGASASASFFWMLLFGGSCMLVLPHFPPRVLFASPFIRDVTAVHRALREDTVPQLLPHLHVHCLFVFSRVPVVEGCCRMVYVYGRRNEGLRMTFLHLFTFRFFAFCPF